MQNTKKLKWLILPLFFALFGIAAGVPAPDFSAKTQAGKTVKLSDYKGKFVLMYFYPKDDTPGCTKQACEFRDRYTKIKAMNAVVLGVSRQDQKSHEEFAAKHKLPFDLLVDEKGEIGKLYGVGEIALIGLSKRESVLIGPDGKVVKFYQDVDPVGHVAEVLNDISAAQKK